MSFFVHQCGIESHAAVSTLMSQPKRTRSRRTRASLCPIFVHTRQARPNARSTKNHTHALMHLVKKQRSHTLRSQALIRKWIHHVWPNVDYRIALKYNYLEWVLHKRAHSFGVSVKPPGSLRIATYNVHYFTDVFEQINTYNGILRDVKTIGADFIGLTEVLVGGKDVTIHPGLTLHLDTLYADLRKCGYPKKTMCNSVPSWYDGIYGNMLLVHDRVPCTDALCTNLNESIFTFPKSKKTVTVSGGHAGTTETRCYIKVQHTHTGKRGVRYTVYVYTTHLDVASESERVRQIQHMIRDSQQHRGPQDVVFMMGDFNTVSAKHMDDKERRRVSYAQEWRKNKYYDFPKSSTLRKRKRAYRVIQALEENAFYDCHADCAADMTTWNQNRVDFIFCNRKVRQPETMVAEYAYTANSDHIPVVLTMNKEVEFK